MEQKSGFHLPLLRQINEVVTIPIIASGGAGNAHHFAEVFQAGCADAALAASIFHYKETSIQEVKAYVREKGELIR